MPDPLELLDDLELDDEPPPPPELEELLFELLLELLDELLLDELEDEEGLDELELLVTGEVELDDSAGAEELDGEVGPVGDPSVVQPTSTTAPARAMPPESSLRNSRRSSRCSCSFFTSIFTGLRGCLAI